MKTSLLKFLASLLLLSLANGFSAWAETDVAPTDPNIHYVGRWDKSDPTLYHSYWSCCYFRVKFTGTTAKVKLDSGAALTVSIDGEAPRPLAGPGTVDLTPTPLKPGDHRLCIQGFGQNEEIVFRGLILDDGAKTEPVPNRPLIEFIGDSITQGSHSFSIDTAEILGCDHTQIAFSGRALTTGFGCSDDKLKLGLDQGYFLFKGFNYLKDAVQKPWDFSYTPDLIVINLGQNDQCGQEPPDVMQKSYINFVHKLREKFPQVPIVAMRPYGGAFAKPIQSAVDELTAAGDAHISYVDTTGWLGPDDFFDGVHPHYYGSFKAAYHLATALAPILQPIIAAKSN